jgi:hypothetical protein
MKKNNGNQNSMQQNCNIFANLITIGTMIITDPVVYVTTD